MIEVNDVPVKEKIKKIVEGRISRPPRFTLYRPSELTQDDNLAVFEMVLDRVRRTKDDGLVSETVITRFLEVHPSLRVCRFFLPRMLGQLFHTPEQLNSLHLTGKEQKQLKANLSIELIEAGLCTEEEIIDLIQENKEIYQLDGRHTYLSWAEAVRLVQENNLATRFLHGCFDKAHWGHTRLQRRVKITEVPSKNTKGRQTVAITAFDPVWAFQHKGTPQDLRPRFRPAFSMTDFILATPYVDAVIVSPLYEVTDEGRDAEWAQIYKELNVVGLGCGPNNLLRRRFSRRMKEQDGVVIQDDRYRVTSSTNIERQRRLFAESNPELSYILFTDYLATTMFGINSLQVMYDQSTGTMDRPQAPIVRTEYRQRIRREEVERLIYGN